MHANFRITKYGLSLSFFIFLLTQPHQIKAENRRQQMKKKEADQTGTNEPEKKQLEKNARAENPVLLF